MRTYPIVIACLFLALPTPTVDAKARDENPPDTPAGRRLVEWLAAFNTGDLAMMKAFVESSYDPDALKERGVDDRLEAMGFVFQDTQGLTFEKVDSATDTEIKAVATIQDSDDRVVLTLKVAPQPPHGIISVGLERKRGPASNAPAPKLSDEQIAQEIDALVERLVKADRFSGAVMIVHDGKTIYERAVGRASKAYDIPNRIDTKFNLGSMNKMFTSVAIAQLAEKGKLSFDDTVAKHLPNFPDKDAASKIKIHHLLNHSSGLGSYFGEKWEHRKGKLKSVADFMTLLEGEKLAFEPGEKFGYSNTGFLVLGAIVEAASGQDYFTYVKENIYEPAGMTDTDAYELDRETPNLAVGYTRIGADGKMHRGEWRNNIFLHVIKGGPAGGGYSTAPDLVRFGQALLGGKLLKPGSVETLTTEKIKSEGVPDEGYGYGFGISRIREHPIVGHGGGSRASRATSTSSPTWDTPPSCSQTTTKARDRSSTSSAT
jgi:CubicO group peptidase (beta-lactamase class C family)